MQIYISMLRASKVMESKAPKCFISILHLSRPGGHERRKDEDKALFGDEERWLAHGMWIQECVDLAQEVDPR